MKISNLNQALTQLNFHTINVMQILVLQEVAHQLKQLKPNQAEYIKPVEVVTYALNRLPSLYASSQEGLSYQFKRAKLEYKPQIIVAVRQGIAAVQRDPLRRSTPLTLKKQQKFRENQLFQMVNPPAKKVVEMDQEPTQQVPEVHSINSHREYCLMAMKLATEN